jgi:hypothetical protein
VGRDGESFLQGRAHVERLIVAAHGVHLRVAEPPHHLPNRLRQEEAVGVREEHDLP